MNWQAVIDNLKISSRHHLDQMKDTVAGDPTNEAGAIISGTAAVVLASFVDALTAGLKAEGE